MPGSFDRIVVLVRSSFWFIPTILTLVAIVSAGFMGQVEHMLHQSAIGWMIEELRMPAESARLALSTIAGSMVTIASLVFSLTLVALTLVSGQHGPRILIRFMDDRPTQFVLGVFLATFVFALISLIRSADDSVDGKLPGLSVVVAAALSVISVAMMIHFIHHIATRIQADVIIGELGADLLRAANRYVDVQSREGQMMSKEDREAARNAFGAETATVAARAGGYFGAVDEAALLDLASRNESLLRFTVRPGSFVLEGQPIAEIHVPSNRNADRDRVIRGVQSLFSLTDQPMRDASISYEINALVEVALRALSPGINDPITANSCIDRITSGFSVLMKRRQDQRVLRDEHDQIRVIFHEEPLEYYFREAYDPIFHAGNEIPMTMEKLQAAYAYLAGQADSSLHKDLIKALKARRIDPKSGKKD